MSLSSPPELPSPFTKRSHLVNDDWYSIEIDPDADSTSSKDLNGYILQRLDFYQAADFKDDDLFEVFTEDFRQWSIEFWNKINNDILGNFNNYLTRHGINVPRRRSPYGPRLREAAQLEEIPRWDPETIQRQIDNHGGLQSRFNPHNDARRPRTNSSQDREQDPPNRSTSNDSRYVMSGGLGLDDLKDPQIQSRIVELEARMQELRDQQEGMNEARRQQQSRGRTDRLFVPQSQDFDNNRLNPNDATHIDEDIYNATSKKVADLGKLYRSDSDRYSGELFNFMSRKEKVFLDLCHKVGLPDGKLGDAFSVMLCGRARDQYIDHCVGRNLTFAEMKSIVRDKFENSQRRQTYLRMFHDLSFKKVLNNNNEKGMLVNFQSLIDDLVKIQPGLGDEYQTDLTLRDRLQNACLGVPECSNALIDSAPTFDGLCAKIQANIMAKQAEVGPIGAYNLNSTSLSEGVYQYPLDRNYRGNFRGFRDKTKRSYRNKAFQERGSRGAFGKWSKDSHGGGARVLKCHVCGKVGCWSSNHTSEERFDAYQKFKKTMQYLYERPITKEVYHAFLTAYEGSAWLFHNVKDAEQGGGDDDIAQCILEMEDEWDEPEDAQLQQYTTELGEVDGELLHATLKERATQHAFTKIDPFTESGNSTKPSSSRNEAFTLEERYATTFQGIMPDSGAAGVSTIGIAQFRALQSLLPSIELDSSKAGLHNITFGKGSAISMGITSVPTPLGIIEAVVLDTNTPFLLCLNDMDRLNVYYDNVNNNLIQGDKMIPVTRKWGHPWLQLDKHQNFAFSHLTESELRQLHRRFGHPSVQRLTKILKRAGEEVDMAFLEFLTRVCRQCQLHAGAPQRYRFSVGEDKEFNSTVTVDIFYINGSPIVHVVDYATSFAAARWLPDMSAKTLWEAIRLCWIDVYQGPPDVILHDAGKNFASEEFEQNARSMGIEVRVVPVEGHNSLGKNERYHAVLRRSFEVIWKDLKGTNTPDEVILQMAVKAVNDTAGPDGLVPTLLVFGSYARISDNSPPSPSITQRAQAIQHAMKEVREIHAKRMVSDALAMRNGPNVEPILSLPLNSDVKVWREKRGKKRAQWEGPFKLIAIDGRDCIVAMPYGPTPFRITHVKPFLLDPDEPKTSEDGQTDAIDEPNRASAGSHDVAPEEEVDKDTIVVQVPGIARTKARTHQAQHLGEYESLDDLVYHEIFHEVVTSAAARRSQPKDVDESELLLTSALEEAEARASSELRAAGKITTAGAPFEKSDEIEWDGLLTRNIIKFVHYDKQKHGGLRIFGSRFVHTIKGKNSNAPFEKSRLVIQGYNDEGKHSILTQAPTIQRMSQRLIAAIAPSLIAISSISPAFVAADGKHAEPIRHSRGKPRRAVRTKLSRKLINIAVFLRDITQAYSQSGSKLFREIYSRLPDELKHKYPPDTLILITGPLYGIPEAGTHWYVAFSEYHKKELGMECSTYDPCLMISTTLDAFGIVGMQTDDTLILADEDFANKEDSKLKFEAKPKQRLTAENPLHFNGCTLSIDGNNMLLTQNGQGAGIKLVDLESSDLKAEYVSQRARGAYIASTCQPEAAFDLSAAAQQQDPDKIDVIALNKRLKWQMENQCRGLTFVPLDLERVKLYIFVDGSLANNKDLSSQIGLIAVLGNEDDIADNQVKIDGNIVHYTSVKCRRVTRSAFASELYAAVHGVDIAECLRATISKILKQLGLPDIRVVLCTDSFSLYDCLVKLGTTTEKRLMIDIMALRQSYENRELYEIRWINGDDNPADAMTKSKPNRALESLIDTNSLTLRMEGWVKRS